MTWREGDVITQRQQTGFDGVDQIGMVALRKISAANAACKQHITHIGMAVLRIKKHHVAGRVAGAVQHLQSAVAQLHRVTLHQPTRGREMLGLRKTKHLALLRQGIYPKAVARVRAFNGQTELTRQGARGPRVVNVRMREENGFERESPLLHCGQQHGDVATGVNQGRVFGVFTPNERAVLFELGDGEGLAVEHGGEVCFGIALLSDSHG